MMYFRASSHSLKILLAVCLLVASGVLILGRWKASFALEVQTQVSQSRVQTELITVTPTGFEPGEITRPQGRFLLAIDNRTGLDELALYLEQENGLRVRSSLNRKSKLAWREVVDLPTGTYILRTANDLSWRCRITITAR